MNSIFMPENSSKTAEKVNSSNAVQSIASRIHFLFAWTLFYKRRTCISCRFNWVAIACNAHKLRSKLVYNATAVTHRSCKFSIAVHALKIHYAVTHAAGGSDFSKSQQKIKDKNQLYDHHTRSIGKSFGIVWAHTHERESQLFLEHCYKISQSNDCETIRREWKAKKEKEAKRNETKCSESVVVVLLLIHAHWNRLTESQLTRNDCNHYINVPKIAPFQVSK